jgi:hypothetical protein
MNTPNFQAAPIPLVAPTPTTKREPSGEDLIAYFYELARRRLLS